MAREGSKLGKVRCKKCVRDVGYFYLVADGRPKSIPCPNCGKLVRIPRKKEPSDAGQE